MKKIHLFAWLNAAAFVLFTFLVSTGILLYYRLPPGSGRWKSIWGLNRREWGEIHFWLALIFLVVMLAHLYLHKNWIYSVLKGKCTQQQRKRLLVGAIGLLAIIVLAAAPLLWG